MAIKGRLETYHCLCIDKISHKDRIRFEKILRFFLAEGKGFSDECYELANDTLALVKLE